MVISYVTPGLKFPGMEKNGVSWFVHASGIAVST
jgi:hypothetical protein